MSDACYREFSASMHERMLRERVPADCTIEITRRCPLECVHCYNNLPMGDSEARHGELTLDEYRRLLDDLADSGCLWLLFTGGEIFARKDFLDIYTYAKQKGFIITLFTNATMITPQIADYLVEWRPFVIEVTLYGGTRETYERVTGLPGSYDRCVRGIRLLRDRGLPLKLKTVALSLNKHELSVMKSFAAELGLPFKFDGMMNPRIDCSQSPLEVRLQPWEIVKLDLEDPLRVAGYKELAARFCGPLRQLPAADDLYQCGGGVIGFAIDPQGRMSICVLSQQDAYDIRRGSFREGWQNFLAGVRQKKITRVTKCTSCGIKDMCGMCPANAHLENGDPEAPVDFLCHVAHLRAAAMDIQVPRHGACEYCEGGSAHAALLDSLQSLRNHGSEEWKIAPAHAPLLPILNSHPGGLTVIPDSIAQENVA
jgi:radical SAM protein with 4Fe4S-binding SPASM domain